MKRTTECGVRRSIFRRGLLTMFACLILMGCIVTFFLQMYQKENEKIFNALVEENLTASHRGQVEEFQRTVRETETLLEAIAAVYSTSQESPEDPWSGVYLEAIRQVNSLYDVRFYPTESMEELAREESGRGANWTHVEALLRGEPVVSDLFCAQQMNGDCMFSVAVPVKQEGQVIGAFRCLLKAELLLQATEKQAYDHGDNYLVRSDGQFLLGPTGSYTGSYDLEEELRNLGFPEEEIRQAAAALKTGSSGFITLHGQGRNQTFVMLSSLGYHDWVLLSAAYSGVVEAYSHSIMRNTALLVASLLLFLLLLLAGAFWLFWQQRKRSLHSQARYDLLSRFSDTILFEYDCLRKTLVFTPNIAARFNIQALEVIHPFDQQYRFTVLHPEDVPLLKGILHKAETMAEDRTESVMLRFLDRDGEYRWMGFQGQVLRDEGGSPLVLVGKISDIHEQKSKEQRLIEKSSIDAMTGALNRETTQARIEKRLNGAEEGFLFMLDVDNFKTVNDSFGHSAGDRLLVRFVEEIRSSFRQEDVVGRIGGDEFVIFMGSTGSTAAARQRAEDLLRRLAAWEDPYLSASIGIAAYPVNGGTYEALYEAADAAMYQAKRRGKSAYCFADASLHSGR